MVRQDQLPLFSWDKFGLVARHGADSTLWVGTRNDEYFYITSLFDTMRKRHKT